MGEPSKFKEERKKREKSRMKTVTPSFFLFFYNPFIITTISRIHFFHCGVFCLIFGCFISFFFFFTYKPMIYYLQSSVISIDEFCFYWCFASSCYKKKEIKRKRKNRCLFYKVLQEDLLYFVPSVFLVKTGYLIL